MNKYISTALLSFCFAYFSIAQTEHEKQHEAFQYIIKKDKIDSLYEIYSKVTPADKNYTEALAFRNQFGWALGKTTQLKKDIPAILSLPTSSNEFPYNKIFRPQKFPASEWSRFYYMSDTLCNYFSKDTSIYRQLLETKTMLEFITQKYTELTIDLPILLSLLDTSSEAYSALMWQYGGALLRTNQREKALAVFEKTYWKTSNNDCLQTMLRMYTTDKSYDKIITLKSEILKDSSGAMLYDLGNAYLNLNQQKEAKIYFKAFVSKIEFIDYYPFAEIKWDNTSYHISTDQLETLGDFYATSDKNKACNYYQLSVKIITKSTDELSFKKQLAAADNEKDRMLIQQKYADSLKLKEESVQRLNQKTKGCK